MRKELKQRWIAALESGEYAKGKGLLCRFNADGVAEYCCLGVLAELEQGEDAWKPFGPYILRMNSDTAIYAGPLDTGVAYRLARVNDDSATFKPVIRAIKELVKETK